MKVGRNDPCPCGSGKKSKKCCMAAEANAANQAQATILIDRRLTDELATFAGSRFGKRASKGIGELFDLEQPEEIFFPFLTAYLGYHQRIEGRPLVEHFLAARGADLRADELAWLEAQRKAWISVWEVIEVKPDVGLRLRDLLTGEERFVQDVSASRSASLRMSLLARVVDWGGVSVLAGSYAHVLPPEWCDKVIAIVRKKLRLKEAVPVERLREEKIEQLLIRTWIETAQALHHQPAPKLCNTDGEDLLITRDHFSVTSPAAEEVARRLADIDGADEDDRDDQGRRVFVVTKAGNAQHARWEITVIGRMTLGADELVVETNSILRADRLRARVEKALGGLVRFRARTHEDLAATMERMKRQGGPAPSRPAVESKEASEIVRAFKAQHYAAWADEPVPALGGKTPRQAVATKDGRRAVDRLLATMEGHEGRLPARDRYDFGGLRRELGV